MEGQENKEVLNLGKKCENESMKKVHKGLFLYRIYFSQPVESRFYFAANSNGIINI